MICFLKDPFSVPPSLHREDRSAAHRSELLRFRVRVELFPERFEALVEAARAAEVGWVGGPN